MRDYPGIGPRHVTCRNEHVRRPGPGEARVETTKGAAGVNIGNHLYTELPKALPPVAHQHGPGKNPAEGFDHSRHKRRTTQGEESLVTPHAAAPAAHEDYAGHVGEESIVHERIVRGRRSKSQRAM